MLRATLREAWPRRILKELSFDSLIASDLTAD
jgi:hypothetical protein